MKRLALLLLVLANGCAQHRFLSSRCKFKPSQASWTLTPRDGRIEGQALDLEEDLPIGNVELVLKDLDKRDRTDAQGKFQFDSVPEGRYVLTTEGSVYLTHGDTLMLPSRGGLQGIIHLTLHKDIVSRCELYRP